MKLYISLALSILVSITSYSQNQAPSANQNIARIGNSVLSKYNIKMNGVNKNSNSGQLTGPYQILPPSQRNLGNQSYIQNIGLPFNISPTNTVRQNGTTQTVDPRNLKLSPNGNLLSPDGYEIEFRTSGNPKVTDVCATPRPYIINSANKNAGLGTMNDEMAKA